MNDKGRPYLAEDVPCGVGCAVETGVFKVPAGGLELVYQVWLPSPNGAPSTPRAAVLFHHGIQESAQLWGESFGDLARAGWVFDDAGKRANVHFTLCVNVFVDWCSVLL